GRIGAWFATWWLACSGRDGLKRAIRFNLVGRQVVPILVGGVQVLAIGRDENISNRITAAHRIHPGGASACINADHRDDIIRCVIDVVLARMACYRKKAPQHTFEVFGRQAKWLSPVHPASNFAGLIAAFKDVLLPADRPVRWWR